MVGIGPGSPEYLSTRAIEVLKESSCIVGYKTYINLIIDLIKGKEIISSGMRAEINRATTALEMALSGKIVSVISSGDPGIYGMAGLVLEVAKKSINKIPIEVIPGISSENAAAALLGGPLMHDHVVISLSDLLTPWDIIEKRLRLAAEGDFVITLYNPKSTERNWQIEKTVDLLLKHKAPETPVGIVRNAMREGQSIVITSLDKMLTHKIDMSTIVIVGNSTTFTYGDYMITRRGYKV